MDKRMIWAGVLAAVGLAGCAPEDPVAVSAPASEAAYEDGITLGGLAQVNKFRAQAGAGFLRKSAVLTQVAAVHAADLVATGQFSHQGSDGSSVGDRARRAGYGYCFIAENIARGQDTLDEVISGWMFSPGHRANMLHSRVDEFGIGIAQGPNGPIWVLVVARGC